MSLYLDVVSQFPGHSGSRSSSVRTSMRALVVPTRPYVITGLKVEVDSYSCDRYGSNCDEVTENN